MSGGNSRSVYPTSSVSLGGAQVHLIKKSWSAYRTNGKYEPGLTILHHCFALNKEVRDVFEHDMFTGSNDDTSGRESSGNNSSTTSYHQRVRVHALKLNEMMDSVVKRLGGEDGKTEEELRIVGTQHAHLRPLGFKTAHWDALAKSILHYMIGKGGIANRRKRETQICWTELVIYMIGKLKDGYNEEVRKVRKIFLQKGRSMTVDPSSSEGRHDKSPEPMGDSLPLGSLPENLPQDPQPHRSRPRSLRARQHSVGYRPPLATSPSTNAPSDDPKIVQVSAPVPVPPSGSHPPMSRGRTSHRSSFASSTSDLSPMDTAISPALSPYCRSPVSPCSGISIASSGYGSRLSASNSKSQSNPSSRNTSIDVGNEEIQPPAAPGKQRCQKTLIISQQFSKSFDAASHSPTPNELSEKTESGYSAPFLSVPKEHINVTHKTNSLGVGEQNHLRRRSTRALTSGAFAGKAFDSQAEPIEPNVQKPTSSNEALTQEMPRSPSARGRSSDHGMNPPRSPRQNSAFAGPDAFARHLRVERRKSDNNRLLERIPSKSLDNPSDSVSHDASGHRNHFERRPSKSLDLDQTRVDSPVMDDSISPGSVSPDYYAGFKDGFLAAKRAASISPSPPFVLQSGRALLPMTPDEIAQNQTDIYARRMSGQKLPPSPRSASSAKLRKQPTIQVSDVSGTEREGRVSPRPAYRSRWTQQMSLDVSGGLDERDFVGIQIQAPTPISESPKQWHEEDERFPRSPRPRRSHEPRSPFDGNTLLPVPVAPPSRRGSRSPGRQNSTDSSPTDRRDRRNSTRDSWNTQKSHSFTYDPEFEDNEFMMGEAMGHSESLHTSDSQLNNQSIINERLRVYL